MSVDILATYQGADGLIQTEYGDSDDGYHYVAVKSPRLTQRMRVANVGDILGLVNLAGTPQDEVSAIDRLLHLGNLKTISSHEILWDWTHLPLAQKLILEIPLKLDEKQTILSDSRQHILFASADENGRRPQCSTRKETCSLSCREFFDHQQVLFFLINLNRVNLSNQRPSVDLIESHFWISEASSHCER